MIAESQHPPEISNVLSSAKEDGVLPPLLKTTQAAKILTQSPQTLAGWRTRGAGPPYVLINGGGIRYILADLLAWIESHRVVDGVVPAGLKKRPGGTGRPRRAAGPPLQKKRRAAR
jgi:hypothetical protein